ncbi:MAG: DUF2264 domain-containing protein [Hyphomicrobiales bacterium]|nr:MAG: DUF2264 domain-containing protein [Hyphomicrobiales bacterium]
MSFDPARDNPLHGNPLNSRADVGRALRDLHAPLLPHFSPGNARLRLDATAAHFDRAAADLEGFARPLWGLAPLAAGGGEFDHWARYREGLANGTDPAHPEFWGHPGHYDQRLVEMAALGFALRLVPHLIWEPLSQAAKDNVAAYLLAARARDFVDSNWRFFRIMIDLGLEQCGIDFDRRLTEDYLHELERYYLGDGWYRDGTVRRVDHYVPFAMHYYGLLYAALSQDTVRAARYRERAALFARDIRHWFDEDGGTLAFGRSLTYRFACSGFWGALAFANVEGLPWGEIKGHYLRHLRWWRDKPMAHRDGILSIGYGYPNLLMSETYNSAGSPYWAFKAFLPLALPETHPFWAAEELPAAPAPAAVPLRHPGMVMLHTPGNVVALSSGQQYTQLRFGAEKYAKFVYSSRYGFSVEADERGFGSAVFDGMLGLSDDGRHYRVRETNDTAVIAGDQLYTKWRPWSDVTVETWLVPASPWHIRIHRITTPRPLQSLEGGFAIARGENNRDESVHIEHDTARVHTATDVSIISGLGSERLARIHRPAPNTNLIASKTVIPQLRTDIAAGTTILYTAAAALPVTADLTALDQPPALPDLAALERAFATASTPVTAHDLKRLRRIGRICRALVRNFRLRWPRRWLKH